MARRSSTYYSDLEKETEAGGLRSAVLESAADKYGMVDNADKVYIRMRPSKETGSELKIVNKGDRFKLLDDGKLDNDFYHVETEDGMNGYIHSGYFKLEE